MVWVKIPQEHHAIFEAALPADDRIATKKMFGGLAAMLNGQMVAGLYAATAFVKLSPADYSALERLGGVPFDPMGNGRTMTETLVLPPSEFADRARLGAWLCKARDHVASLPDKTRRAPSAAKRGAPTAGGKKAAATPKKPRGKPA